MGQTIRINRFNTNTIQKNPFHPRPNIGPSVKKQSSDLF